MTKQRDRIEFWVEEELPPKKDGAQSMWGKSVEIQRLIALRLAAFKAMNGREPFERNIHLNLEIHVGKGSVASAGDLDSFITGVCDGLMRANERIRPHSDWEVAEPEILPEKCIAIEDDSEVVSIMATKAFDPERYGYTVILEGE